MKWSCRYNKTKDEAGREAGSRNEELKKNISINIDFFIIQ